MRPLLMRGMVNAKALTFIKLALSGLLIYWLISSGKLDLHHITIFFDQPWIAVMAIAHFFCVGLLLGGIRWQLLLRGVGIKPRLRRTFSLQSIGLFFSTVMPGAVGGDIIKGVYVIRDQESSSKSRTMMTILLDRVSGLMGLFTLGAISIALNFSTIWHHPLLRSIAVMILSMLAVMLLMHAFVFVPIADDRDPFLKLFSTDLPGMNTLKKIYLALRSYHEYPSTLVFAWLLSIIIQLVTMIYFLAITDVVVSESYSILDFASVFPLGILTAALPLAPGGVGVGHVAFERLFALVNIGDGANIFNIYVLGYLTLSLFGALPYIFLRTESSEASKHTEGIK